jgi:ABC-type sugar transport system permease subunit
MKTAGRFWRATTGHLLVAPAVLSVTLFVWVPVVLVVGISLRGGDILGMHWVGVQNYIEIFRNVEWLRALQNAIAYPLILVPLCVASSTVLGLLLLRVKQQTRALIIFLAVFASIGAGAPITRIWRMTFMADGPVAGIIKAIGFGDPNILMSRWPAFAAVCVVMFSSWAGGYVVYIYLAAAGARGELREAALVDGCTEGQVLRFIVLPIIRPTILMSITLCLIAVESMWETIWFLTDGGPRGATGTMALMTVKSAFVMGDRGSAAAMSLISLAVVFGLSILKRRIEQVRE